MESVGTVRHAIAEPRSVPLQIRDTYLRMWRSRGGGFYGLGYVVAFAVLEVQATVSSWEGASDNIAGLVMQEVLQFVFKFAAQSMLNGFLALGWPIFVVQKLGGAGLALLAVVWWLFDRYARPWIAVRLPEPPPSARSSRRKRTKRSRNASHTPDSADASPSADDAPEAVAGPPPVAARDSRTEMNDAMPIDEAPSRERTPHAESSDPHR
jgi:hypothetical protein